MSRVVQVLLLVLGVAVTAIGVASAGERTHTVAPGESASSIAKKYYGNFDLTPLLLAYNGRESTVLQPGETLRIPYCEVHRVKRGDSWSALSHRYLKGKSNYAVVAELNDMLPEKPLQPGDEIVFPVFLDHRLERGETLGALAERYYGQPSLGRLLQESNVLDNPRRLSVGETVQIPLLDFKLTAPVEKAKKVETAQLKNLVVHFNHRSIAEFVDKMNLYTSSDAPLSLANGRGGLRNRPLPRSFAWRLFCAPLSVFWNRYFRHRGFRDGVHGFVVAVLMGFYQFVEYGKVWELKNVTSGKPSA